MNPQDIMALLMMKGQQSPLARVAAGQGARPGPDLGDVSADWWTFGKRRRREAEMPAEPLDLAAGGALGARTGKRRPSPAAAHGAIRGAGDGREDLIPAALSDGEHVIDAETVSLIGDGSNKAGHERIESMKSGIRTHKGRKLSKGKISPDAKPLTSYMRKEG